MTKRECARKGLQIRQQKARQRAAQMLLLIEQGECVKRAAYRVGVSDRTASRYRKLSQGAGAGNRPGE